MALSKKIISLVLAIFLIVCSTGCSAFGYKDGTYRAEMPTYEHGYKDYLVIEVRDGELSVKEFDSVNENGELKSQSESYRESMEPVAGTYPEKYIKDIIAEFENKNQKLSKVTAVAGATTSTNNFKMLMQAAMQNAKKGITDTAVVSTDGK